MIQVDQTVFGFPGEDGSPGGNCFSACVASILELPLLDVPYFMGDNEWWERFRRWCVSRSVIPTYQASYPPALGYRDHHLPHYMLGGLSPRAPAGRDDALHSVVAEGHRIVHDPHPDRTGLVNRQDCIFLRKVRSR